MTPTPVIIPPWYSGELTPQIQAALTVATPMPQWFWVGVLMGIMIGIVLVAGADLWQIRRK